jgi:hypothetical protein
VIVPRQLAIEMVVSGKITRPGRERETLHLVVDDTGAVLPWPGAYQHPRSRSGVPTPAHCRQGYGG